MKIIGKIYLTRKDAKQAFNKDIVTLCDADVSVTKAIYRQDLQIETPHTLFRYLSQDNIEEMKGGMFDLIYIFEEMDQDMYMSMIYPLEASGCRVYK